MFGNIYTSWRTPADGQEPLPVNLSVAGRNVFVSVFVPCLEPERSELGPVLGVYFVSREAERWRVQLNSSALSWENRHNASSSKPHWNSPENTRGIQLLHTNIWSTQQIQIWPEAQLRTGEWEFWSDTHWDVGSQELQTHRERPQSEQIQLRLYLLNKNTFTVY